MAIVGQHSWGGSTVDADGAAVTETWIDIQFKWSDVPVIVEIEKATKRGCSRGGLRQFEKLNKEKQKRVVQLICKIEGIEEPIYKDSKVIKGNIKVTVEDIELLLAEFRKYVSVEVKE